jgi:dTDP-4-dehydrorhamnose 3,5-epimerase
MNIIKTLLPGVVIIERDVFKDSRGHFIETFQADRYQQHGLPTHFVQDNFSYSYQNVLRGLHYQLQHPQGKLVSVTHGKVLDIIVDIRIDSPTFGKSITVEISDQNCRQVYIPVGFAHGFCVLSEYAGFIYKCTDYYHPDDEHGVCWHDPDLEISLPIDAPILSKKDAVLPRLKNIPENQLPRMATDE